jgi:BirA family biotin operon repressor/biotin-[acetyl-CoA-carboxylase] ligase
MAGMFRHIPLDDVGSTNDEARARLGELTEGPFVLTGKRQLAGRGRRGRNWVSPEGNLYASFAFVPTEPLSRLPELSFVAALSVCDMARELTGEGDNIRCKWPNDVLAGDAKLCGILLETAGLPDGDHAVIVGIGVNVASSPADTPYPSAFLNNLGFDGKTDAVLQVLATQLGRWLHLWSVEGFDAVRQAWLDRASGLGQPVVARLPDQDIEGRFAGIAEDGALMLETGAGDVLRIAAADVFRPGLMTQDDPDASGH